ncbi:MAG: hypothetical protein AB7P49_05805 [Bdellovibrionales bacterium]
MMNSAAAQDLDRAERSLKYCLFSHIILLVARADQNVGLGLSEQVDGLYALLDEQKTDFCGPEIETLNSIPGPQLEMSVHICNVIDKALDQFVSPDVKGTMLRQSESCKREHI